MLRKSLQLALIHAAVAMTLVPINSTLNRVMIKELAVSATLVALLASLPYLFSPLQVLIGSYADRHPLFGRRRSVYIAIWSDFMRRWRNSGAAGCFFDASEPPARAFSSAF